MRDVSRKRLRPAIAAVLLIVGVLVAWQGFVLLTPPSEHQTVRLADGSVVELLGYSFGKKHELRVRPPMKGPAGLMALFHPAPVIRAAETDQDALLLWVRIPHKLELHPGYGPPYIATAQGANGFSYPSNFAEYVDVKYSVGFPYEALQYVVQANGMASPIPEEVVSIPVTCYPQRDSRFALDLYQHGGKKLATFQIVNPKPERPAPFPKAALPDTQQDADLKVTLESILPTHTREVMHPDGSTVWWGGTGTPTDGVLLPGDEGRQRITLSYLYRGKPDPNWKISELEAFDAMGNRTHNLAAAPTWPSRTYFPPTSQEPYRLKVGVQKSWKNQFDPDEKWTVTDIPLPSNGKPVPIHGDFRRNDLHLQLLRVYGMGGKNFSPDLAIVQVKVETPLANPVLLCHVEDQLGRTIRGPWPDTSHMFPPDGIDVSIGNIEVMHTGMSGDSDPHYRSIPLKIPKGVKRLKLAFTLPKTHFVEFTAPAFQSSPQ